jgi:hypothetical protein
MILDVLGLMIVVTLIRELIKGKSINYFGLIFSISSSIYISFMIYVGFAFSPYITVFDDYFIGKNSLKMKIAEMNYKTSKRYMSEVKVMILS